MSELVLAQTDAHVAILTLNRPKVLNALSTELMDELIEKLERFDADEQVRVMVLAGNERAFAAGADINQMADQTAIDMYLRNQFAKWERIKRISKPIIAAVSGYALGGGCELMMHCDIIVASETARIGQPEINIGIIPGAGGTQRLTRAIGKFQAMDVVLSGRFLTAAEAHRAGLVSRVVPPEHFLTEAIKLAHELAEKPPLQLRIAKEAVLKAWETPLAQGMEYERKLLYLCFATQDQKEGMKAFIEKRKPEYVGR